MCEVEEVQSGDISQSGGISPGLTPTSSSHSDLHSGILVSWPVLLATVMECLIVT